MRNVTPINIARPNVTLAPPGARELVARIMEEAYSLRRSLDAVRLEMSGFIEEEECPEELRENYENRLRFVDSGIITVLSKMAHIEALVQLVAEQAAADARKHVRSATDVSIDAAAEE